VILGDLFIEIILSVGYNTYDMDDTNYTMKLAEGIDNEKYYMKDQLKLILGRFAKRAKIAVGFFFVTAFDNVEEEIMNLDEIKIVMGVRTNVMTREELDIATEAQRMRIELGYSKERVERTVAEKIEEVNSEDDLVRFDVVVKLITEGKMKVRVRAPNRGYFHSKVYWFDCQDERGDDLAIVGSHNLSKSAQEKNEEASAVIRNPSSTKFWEDYFDRKWEDSIPFNRELLRLINQSPKYQRYRRKKRSQKRFRIGDLPQLQYLPPIKFFRAMFNELDRDYLLEKKGVLRVYQKIDYNISRDIIQKFGGVIIADSVGLGKSFIAARLVKDYIDAGKSYLFIVPPNTMKQWKDYLNVFNIRADKTTMISMYQVSQSDFDATGYKDRDVVVVDESHNFRNTDSNRWNNFIREIKSPNTDYILLSATPINNKVRDLYAQVQMFENTRFANENLIDAYKDLGEYSKQEEEGDEDIDLFDSVRDVRRKLIVRTTRKELKEIYGKIVLPGVGEVKIRDPNVEQEVYKFTNPEYERLFRSFIPDFIEKLQLPHISIINPEASRNLHGLYKILLYKRMESSIYALYKSLENLEERNQKLALLLNKRTLDEIRILEKKEYRKELEEAEQIDEEAIQTYLDREFSDESQDGNVGWSAGTPKKRYIGAIHHDLGIIDRFKSILNSLRASWFEFDDDKLDALKDKLKEYGDRKVIIFSQFTDTVDYLYENLKHLDPQTCTIRKVTGNTKHKILECVKFSPTSYSDEMKKQLENELNVSISPPWTDLLITSDTLSEGVNLQEADVVINYDLPWNPVRIIQRIGRANRIGRIGLLEAVNFLPEDHIDSEMNLIRTLKGKINNIISIIGAEHCILSPEEMLMIKRKQANDMDLIRKKREMVAEIDLDNLEESSESSKITDLDDYLTKMAKKGGIEVSDLGSFSVQENLPYTVITGKDSGLITIYRLTIGSEEYFDFVKMGKEGFADVGSIETLESPRYALEREDIDVIKDFVEKIAPDIENKRKMSQRIVFDRDTEVAKRNLLGKLLEISEASKILEVLQPSKKEFKSSVRKLALRLEKMNVPKMFRRTLQSFRTKWFKEDRYRVNEDKFLGSLMDLVKLVSRKIAPNVDERTIKVEPVGFVVYENASE
jgi:SNF2 family DNA or RNA helicase